MASLDSRRVAFNRSNVLKTSSRARASRGFDERRNNSASIAGTDSGASATSASSASLHTNQGKWPSAATRPTATEVRSLGFATDEAICASLANSSGSRSARSSRSSAQLCRSTPITVSRRNALRRRQRLDGVSSSALGSGVTAESTQCAVEPPGPIFGVRLRPLFDTYHLRVPGPDRG